MARHRWQHLDHAQLHERVVYMSCTTGERMAGARREIDELDFRQCFMHVGQTRVAQAAGELG